MWSGRRDSLAGCYLVEHSGEPGLRSLAQTVYATYRKEEDTFPPEEEISPPEECEEENGRNDDLTQQLKQCKSDAVVGLQRPMVEVSSDLTLRLGETFGSSTFSSFSLRTDGQ